MPLITTLIATDNVKMSPEEVFEKPAFEKYVHKPFLGSSHSWARQKLAEFDAQGTALDVGSGQGAMGIALQELGFKHRYAIEIDEQTREHTQQLYSKIATSIEELTDQRFDLVLLLDIIEHLQDPQKFLKQVTQYCQPGANILLSVPNIAHWAIRLMLLCGYFEYAERGPLDKTHLHFFTKRHLKAMLSSIPELQIISWNSSIVPLELLLPESWHTSPIFKTFSSFRHVVAQKLPGLTAYQLLVHLKVRDIPK